MKIAVPAEQAPGERRVAATPETVKKLVALGASVAVEAGAGAGAFIADAAYGTAGAVVSDRGSTLDGAGLVLGVQGPPPADIPSGCIVAAALAPYQHRERLQAYAARGIEALAMELMPRISRAQSMDILSSQSNLSGYKAVIDAAAVYNRAFPMMMTAAGTVSAARLFVMGVGVAGLQAIATARRLGAIVSATDVRPATREQIVSLGAKPVFVEEGNEGAETAGGYAREMSEDYRQRQAALVSETIARQDVVITTALIPGRPAPRLVTATQLATMKPGSVVVDLAVEQGGNIEGSVPGEVVRTAEGITIIGHTNYPSRMAADASALFARNLLNFVTSFWDREKRTLMLPDDDEIVAAIRMTKGGAMVHPGFAG
jgi:NAD(P) transhydrogenase subunit alpha